ncbi:MAG: hypothetical protein N2505_05095 [Endomicrobia bacterium]|nr:hypothetical protein [Endomicrobiia bacterium]
MKKNFLNLLFFLYLLCLQLLGKEIKRYKYFAECARIDGITGKIYTINSYTVSYKRVLFGLHRFDLSLNYGVLKNAEIGIKLNLNEQQDITKITKNITLISPYVKYHVINSSLNNPIDVSLGFYRTDAVIIVEKLLPDFFSTSFVVNFFLSFTKKEKYFYSFAFSKYTEWIEFIVDVNPYKEFYSLGIRALLIPDIRLSLFLIDLKNLKDLLFYNFIFGISVKI